MKKPILIILATSGLGLAADPIFTAPAGFVKLGNTNAGQDAVAADTDVNLALPLEAESVFSGLVASTTDLVPEDPGPPVVPEVPASITVQGTPAWAVDQWAPASGTPYCAIISSGTENGIRGVIVGNTADTLSITVTTPGTITNVAAGDSVQIRKCWTLSTIFADAVIPDNSEVLVYNQDDSGINHSSGAKYLFFAGIWYDASDFSTADDVVIHPGERFILRSQGAAVPTLTLFGDVPLAASRVDLTKDGGGAEDMEIGHANPTPVIVGDLSLPVEDNDELLIYDNAIAGTNKSSAAKLIFFADVWYDASDFSDVTASFELAAGQGFVLRRADLSSAGPTEWSEPAPYTAP